MDELTINIRIEREGAKPSVDYTFEAYADGDNGVEDDLEDDRKFTQLIEALSDRFAAVADNFIEDLKREEE